MGAEGLPVHPGHALHVAHQLVGDGVVRGRDGVDVHLWAPQLHFCAQHGITADIELIRAEQINAAYERMLKGDVKYRFVIDCATLG